MAVPSFQEFMLPLLQFAADGKEHNLAEARDPLISEFALTNADLKELLSSGQSTFGNRVAWAKTYLSQAGLLVTTRRGHFRISPSGRKVLKNPPAQIDLRFLSRFPEFSHFRALRKKGQTEDRSAAGAADTPEESLEQAYIQIRKRLSSELLARVKASSPDFFERLVVKLLVRMGYGGYEEAGTHTGRSGDEGIDGIIKEDRLGLDSVYLQAKKWEGTVSRPEVQKFVGALHGKRAKKGVFITTGSFSADALEYVEHIDPKVVLIDGKKLSELMIDFDVAVSTIAAYALKRIDSDFFSDE